MVVVEERDIIHVNCANIQRVRKMVNGSLISAKDVRLLAIDLRVHNLSCFSRGIDSLYSDNWAKNLIHHASHSRVYICDNGWLKESPHSIFACILESASRYDSSFALCI